MARHGRAQPYGIQGLYGETRLVARPIRSDWAKVTLVSCNVLQIKARHILLFLTMDGYQTVAVS